MGFKNIPGMSNTESSGSATTGVGDFSSETPTMSYNIMCVLGFIISLSVIILLFCFFTFFGMSSAILPVVLCLLDIAALIVSIIGLSTCNKDKHLGFGLGIAGLILSIIGILACIIILILMIALATVIMSGGLFSSPPTI